jgi:hypothetical protein
MSLGCKCDSGLSNTGVPNCVTLQSVTSKFIMVPLEDSTGAKNYIDLTATLDQAYFEALVNQADASKRFFPLPLLENVALEKGDSTFEEAPSGRKVFIKQAKRSFAGELWEATPQLLSKIQDNRCVEFGIYIVDVNGSLVGSKVGDKLYPIPVDNQSFDARLMYATDTTVQKLMVSFDFYRLFDEGTLWLITSDEVMDFNLLEGLLDVEMEKVSATQTDLVLDATLMYGTALNPIKVSGLVLADFTLSDASTGANISLLSVTAVANRYTLTFASQTAGLPVEVKVQKTGYVGELLTDLS